MRLKGERKYRTQENPRIGNGWMNIGGRKVFEEVQICYTLSKETGNCEERKWGTR
jgi:hypothetical protein